VKPAIAGHLGVDIKALMRALPISGLEPQCLASIGGLIDAPKDQRWREIIDLLEPPAGQRVPYIEPAKAIEKLLRRQGVAPDDAQARSREAAVRMRADLADDHWVNFYDDLEPESPECLPVSEFVAWVRKEGDRSIQLSATVSNRAQEPDGRASEHLLVPPEILAFFEQAAEVAISTPTFRGPDNWHEPWSLESLPAFPPPKAMIEFVPGAPWADMDNWNDWNVLSNPFNLWREAIRPVALKIEKALGEPVYYFADLDDELDDDDVHRFLVLHWCCIWKPESAYVRFLVKVSGASNVEELKAALIDPVNFTQPFKMNSAFVGLETLNCRIDYLPPDRQKTVTVVFSTMQARNVAQALLAQKIGARAFIVAPKELATDEWVKQATRYCRDWCVRYVRDRKLNDPIEILSVTDELSVIADEMTPNSGFNLKLSESAEDLLWLALSLEVEAKYYFVEGSQLSNPDSSLVKRGVPERIAARQTRRAAFMGQLKVIRLENDFGSSGLWGADGKMLGYDQMALPFPIVRQIAAWQRDYDDTMNPPYMGDDPWWDRHEQEALSIAVSLQDALGSDTSVQLYQVVGWQSVDQIGSLKRRE
jgi:hypothetical protein